MLSCVVSDFNGIFEFISLWVGGELFRWLLTIILQLDWRSTRRYQKSHASSKNKYTTMLPRKYYVQIQWLCVSEIELHVMKFSKLMYISSNKPFATFSKYEAALLCQFVGGVIELWTHPKKIYKLISLPTCLIFLRLVNCTTRSQRIERNTLMMRRIVLSWFTCIMILSDLGPPRVFT